MKIVGIAGGSGSGKTTFASMLKDLLGNDSCAILRQDSYYHDQSQEFSLGGGCINFDHPDSIDFELLSRHLSEIKGGRSIGVPVYDFESHRRLDETEALNPCPLVIVEGILILAHSALRQNFDTKVFIDASDDIRFARRLFRDTRERGRDPASVKQQFLAFVKPMHDQFVEPSRHYADKVYSGEGAMDVNARDLLVHIGLMR